ncbi:hypothetical protein OZ410_09150 [Robiginitalea sp. M366]|uniref:hypothetical protein n=1 Tax=Robiginitalea aestuariiviva TaxID=3036903 RepID=UPI00240E19DB|nr:hypothetical protein [Robiginitalea aestuariiviva]MDG1572481.1 hypothetical protein [Robiginitalea aestuariiviva]
MAKTLEHIADFIALNFLLIFGIYSMLYFIFRNRTKYAAQLYAFDRSALQLTLWVGTLWVVIKILGLAGFIVEMRKETTPEAFAQHMSWFFGKSGFQLLFWIVLPQLLRINFVQRNLFPRILAGMLFAFSFEAIWMVLVKSQRAYIPLWQSSDFNLPVLILGLLIKTLVFVLLVGTFQFGKERIRPIIKKHR